MTPPQVVTEAVAVTTSETTTGIIKFTARGGSVHIPAGSGLTTLTWWVRNPGPTQANPSVAATQHAAYDADGAAIAQTVAAGRSYPIPSDLFGNENLYAVGNTTGTIYVTTKT